MPIKSVVCCDECEKILDQKNPGYAISGNISHVDNNKTYESDELIGGGLVGDNLSNRDQDQGATVERISYFCQDCFVSIVFGTNVHLVGKDNPLKREITQSQMNDSIPYTPPKRR